MSGFANKYSDLDLCLIDTKATAYSKDDSKDPFILWRKDAFKILGQLYAALSPNGRIKWNAKHQYSKSIIPGMLRICIEKQPIMIFCRSNETRID